MRIECKDVEYVLAIAKHQSLTMAAEELYITQPALSKYVKTIEERIGAPLFVHGKRPLQLTKEGELFVTYAKEVSTAIASLETEMDRLMRKDYEIVRVGYASNGLREHIYHAVQNIYQKEPGVRFELQEMTSQQIWNGSVDFLSMSVNAWLKKLGFSSISELPDVYWHEYFEALHIN